MLLITAPARKILVCFDPIIGERVWAFKDRLLISKTDKQQKVKQDPALCIRKNFILLVNNDL
jgi:hypothetical protein